MNAQIEFNNFIVGKPDVICAYVQHVGYYYDDEPHPSRIELPLGYTDEQYGEFMAKLDFNYDDGYGSQNLDGVIWFKDGSWATRGEYDGSEWWQHHKRPNVPSHLYPSYIHSADEPTHDSASYTEEDRQAHYDAQADH
jgi:hypothetical protein